MNLNGKVVGASLEDDGTTIIHVQVPGRIPVQMSVEARLTLLSHQHREGPCRFCFYASLGGRECYRWGTPLRAEVCSEYSEGRTKAERGEQP
jgi:hypothetical protein